MLYARRMNATNQQSQWLDAKTFAEEYPFSERVFWKWVAARKLPVYRVGPRKTLVRRGDLEQLLESYKAGGDEQ